MQNSARLARLPPRCSMPVTWAAIQPWTGADPLALAIEIRRSGATHDRGACRHWPNTAWRRSWTCAGRRRSPCIPSPIARQVSPIRYVHVSLLVEQRGAMARAQSTVSEGDVEMRGAGAGAAGAAQKSCGSIAAAPAGSAAVSLRRRQGSHRSHRRAAAHAGRCAAGGDRHATTRRAPTC